MMFNTERPLTLSLSLKGRGDAAASGLQMDDPARCHLHVLKEDEAALPLPLRERVGVRGRRVPMQPFAGVIA